jgi:hypothetical protein
MALKDTTFAESLNCWGEDSNLTLWSLSFAGMANLTLLSLSFNKERDVCAGRQGGGQSSVDASLCSA